MSARPDVLSAAREAVAELLEIVGWLAVSLLPGTHKPYSPPQMSAEKRAEMDAADRLHRQVSADGNRHTIMPLGESPAPMDLSVLDLLVDVLTMADHHDDLVSTAAGVEPLPSALSHFADPAPYLWHVDVHLARAGRCVEACALPGGCGHPSPADVAKTVHEACEALVFRARSMLGLVTDGQLLDALCPWCGGRTSKHPVGGARTLRVKMLPVVNNATGTDEEIPAIVCEGNCSAPTSDYGLVWRGHPAWHSGEWDWLVKRIEKAAADAAKVDAVVAGLAS